MAALVRPAVLPVCAMTGGGGNDKRSPPQQWSWWGGNKQRLPHQPRRQPGGNGGRGGGGGALDQVLGVLRRDGEFLQAAAGAPLRDIFWLRFLEKKKQQRRRKQPKPKPKPPEQQQQQEEAAAASQAPSFPPPSYQPGLSPRGREASRLGSVAHALFLLLMGILPIGRIIMPGSYDC